jgi:hypothetical protein
VKAIFPTLLIAAGTTWSAENLTQTYAGYGLLIVTQFVSAPFPHPLRAEGHKWGHDFFPADKHYNDNTVALFIPKGFRVGKQVDFVVHFHGWGNHVSSVLHQHQLIEQLAESQRNAVLVVPQGPRDASDSFGGKLEDPDGFKRFMNETMATLRSGVGGRALRKAQIGNIILSGHSGGYRAIAFTVAQGGLTDHVREVWLFDGFYAQAEKFANWSEHQPSRFLNIYTEQGGTKEETEKFMADLRTKQTGFCAKEDVEVTPQDLQTNRFVFLYTDLSHNEVVNQRKTFCQFLKTSCLAEVKRSSKRGEQR